ncbi:MAG: hypothetical protein Q9181_007700 [Wetmoreana brouardii]
MGCEAQIGLKCVDANEQKAKLRQVNAFFISAPNRSADGKAVVPQLKQKAGETVTKDTGRLAQRFKPNQAGPETPILAQSSKPVETAPGTQTLPLISESPALVEPMVRQSPKSASPAPTPALPQYSKQASTATDIPNHAPIQVEQGAMDGNRHTSLAALLESDTATLLSEQRRDIDRIMTNVDALLQDMKTVKASMDYIKFQQDTFADHEATRSPTGFGVDIGALTENVANVSTKVNEVDSLKTELKMMERRIQQLERTVQAGGLRSASPSQVIRSAHAQPEPVRNGSNDSQEIPSSTFGRSQTEQPLARASLASSILPSQEDEGSEDLSDLLSKFQQKPAVSETSSDEGTPEADLRDIVRPQITSAEKVAAQKRRRQPSSSSSSSPQSPAPKRQVGRPRIKGQPDWNTKPKKAFVHRGKLISLNDHNTVLTSDPEDSDYDPSSQPQELEIPGAKEISSSFHSKPPVRLPTPEWEKPDWEGPSYTTNSSTRGRSTARRGMSGRSALPDREALRRTSSGYNNRNDIYADSPIYWNDDEPAGTGSQSGFDRYSSTPDALSKPRDSEGRLLLPNGKVDGRSIRYQRAREAIAKVGSLGGEREEFEKIGFHDRARKARAKLAALERQKKDGGSYEQQMETRAMKSGGVEGHGRPDGYIHAAASAAVDEYSSVTHQASSDSTLKGDTYGEASSFDAPPARNAAKGDTHAQLMQKVFPWR